MTTRKRRDETGYRLSEHDRELARVAVTNFNQALALAGFSTTDVVNNYADTARVALAKLINARLPPKKAKK